MGIAAFWREVRAELQSGRRVYLCFVVGQKKGSPGTTAARMLLTEEGRQVGTIGGGIMEKGVLERAAGLLAEGMLMAPALQHFTHRESEPEAASGLICGGAQTNLHWVVEPAHDFSWVDEALTRAEGEEGFELRVTAEGPAVAACSGEPKGRPELSESGTGWLVRLPLINLRRIAIFGGGHCGLALASQMDRLDYRVSLVEPRESLWTLSALPPAVDYLPFAFEEGAGRIGFQPQTHAVVMTYSMWTDIEALSGVLKGAFKTVGLMGSRPKVAKIRKELRRKGLADSRIGSIRAPIGLGFNSDTPEEIAVSIAAQILLEREEGSYG